MNGDEEFIWERIKLGVWGGFDTFEDVQSTISLFLNGGEDEQMLRELVAPEFQRKREAEKSWDQVTDVDRLEEVFESLKENGVLCLHHAGNSMSHGHYDAHEALRNYEKDRFFGYCFYHGQDLENVLAGRGLMLAYDHVNGDVPEKVDVGSQIQKELEKKGFSVEWDGSSNTRINIPNFDWKKRSAGDMDGVKIFRKDR